MGGDDEADGVVKRSGPKVPAIVVRIWVRGDQLELRGQNLACFRISQAHIAKVPGCFMWVLGLSNAYHHPRDRHGRRSCVLCSFTATLTSINALSEGFQKIGISDHCPGTTNDVAERGRRT